MIDSLLLNYASLVDTIVRIGPNTIIRGDGVVSKIDPCLRTNAWGKDNIIITLNIIVDKLLLIRVYDWIDVVKSQIEILKVFV